MHLSNKSILLSANEAVSAGDNEGFLSYCTDDVKWEFVGDLILEGKDAVRQYMQETYIDPPQFKVENLIEGRRIHHCNRPNQSKRQRWKSNRLHLL